MRGNYFTTRFTSRTPRELKSQKKRGNDVETRGDLRFAEPGDSIRAENDRPINLCIALDIIAGPRYASGVPAIAGKFYYVVNPPRLYFRTKTNESGGTDRTDNRKDCD